MGCSEERPKQTLLKEIHGRNEAHLYQIQVPLGWESKGPEELYRVDTKLALSEFMLDSIRIAIHNFPDRIPPGAQIERWKKQFTTLEESTIIPQSFSGYAGYLFEGIGELKGEKVMMLAWTMQPGKTLKGESNSDITIKATGPENVMNDLKESIITFARSFELQQEIP